MRIFVGALFKAITQCESTVHHSEGKAARPRIPHSASPHPCVVSVRWQGLAARNTNGGGRGTLKGEIARYRGEDQKHIRIIQPKMRGRKSCTPEHNIRWWCWLGGCRFLESLIVDDKQGDLKEFGSKNEQLS